MTKLRLVFGLTAVLTGCGGLAVATADLARAPSTCRQSHPAVTWLGPVLEAERLEQDAWCAAVGAPLMIGVAAEPAVLDSLPVITWNVKVGGGDVRELVQRLRRGAFTGGEPVAHFALLLQEAYRAGDAVPIHIAGARVPRGIEAYSPSGSRHAIDDIARELGLSIAYVPSMRNGARNSAGVQEDRGNAILTTLPLRDVVAIELPLIRQRRVVVAATISGRKASGDAWQMQLASVHLENRPARGITGVRGRHQQMEMLLEKLPAASTSVIGGDLNTWASGDREPAVKIALVGHPETGPSLGVATFDGPAFFDWRLDYLFARLPGGRVSEYRLIPHRFGSDHHPVMAWVHLPN